MGKVLHACHTVHEVKAHYVWSLKYRKRLLFNERYQGQVKKIIEEIGERYWYRIDQIGTDGDHIHLFIQSNPDDSFSKIVRTIFKNNVRIQHRPINYYYIVRKLDFSRKVGQNLGHLRLEYLNYYR
ncbi:IS200/IS605 family transposase [Patescibacteria group bacterium]|nr:IS200/IS605 family transposase [Patescibacteria group bacterium]